MLNKKYHKKVFNLSKKLMNLQGELYDLGNENYDDVIMQEALWQAWATVHRAMEICEVIPGDD